jgi:hypothetical protein
MNNTLLHFRNYPIYYVIGCYIVTVLIGLLTVGRTICDYTWFIMVFYSLIGLGYIYLFDWMRRKI